MWGMEDSGGGWRVQVGDGGLRWGMEDSGGGWRTVRLLSLEVMSAKPSSFILTLSAACVITTCCEWIHAHRIPFLSPL